DGGATRAYRPEVAYTHFYQGEYHHRGIGAMGYYTDHHEERDFGVYKDDSLIKIYNVSLDSFIPNSIFPKISYDQFFEMLDNETYSQDELRDWVKNKIKEIS
ncbi:hypothetical protein LCGC14_2926560, partial [marine sediment metagenome]